MIRAFPDGFKTIGCAADISARRIATVGSDEGGFGNGFGGSGFGAAGSSAATDCGHSGDDSG